MMLSVLVWLAMQGQVQAALPCSSTKVEWSSDYTQATVTGLPHGCTIKLTGQGRENSSVIIPLDQPKPAEHVIEIKTVREDHGTAKGIGGLGGAPHCDKPDDSLEYTDQCKENICTSMYIAPHCVKLTRELWIDGVRWGVVKGLE